MIVIGSLALIGFPFLTGFYSKDLVRLQCKLTGNIHPFRGVGRLFFDSRKASMYSSYLDFIRWSFLAQRRLLALFRLSLIPIEWRKGSSVFYHLFYFIFSPHREISINRGILFNRLDWRVIVPRVCEASKKFRFHRRFGDGLVIRPYDVGLEVSPIFPLFLIYNERSKSVNSSSRYYSSIPQDLASRYNEKTRKFKNIFPLIYDPRNLEQAWYEIKSNQGHMTSRGGSNETFDGLELEWFKEVSKKLEFGTYNYRPARKVFIPKPGKSDKRALTLGSPRDKVIQRAFLRVLQQIYEGVIYWDTVNHKKYEEYQDPYRIFDTTSKKIHNIENIQTYQIKKWILKPIFHEDSFGFRPNRSPHSALKKIKRMWNPLVWLWSPNLIRAFDKINQHRLINEIEKTIDDQKLLNELWKMFKVKIIGFSNSTELDKSTPQGSILSHFLFNIYMTPLDYYIKELKIKYETVGSKIINSEFRRRTRPDQKKFEDLGSRQRYKLTRLERDKAKADNVPQFEIINKPINIHYARYADDFLIGLNMEKKLARIVTTKIRDFIKADLHLGCHGSDSNTKLIHGRSELIKFLGFQIGCYPCKYNAKSTHLIRFYKLRANTQRKRVVESEAYFKLVERVCAKYHRQIIDSIRTHGQTLVKRSQIMKVNDHRIKVKMIHALKRSLSIIESETMMSDIKSHIPKVEGGGTKYTPSLLLAEQKRLNLLRMATQKWIQKAVDLANKEDEVEVKDLVGEYLSPRFIEARETYLKELEKISSKDFSEKVIKRGLKKAKPHQAQNAILNGISAGIKIRILFPVEDMKKRLRSLGLLHKVITRPTGINYLTSKKDHDIVSWYSLKANGLWNYYCCADNIWELKKILNWVLRYSLLGTLASKYKSSIKQMINKYTLAPKIVYTDRKKGKEHTSSLAAYPSREYFNKKKKDFNSSSLAPIELESILRARVNTLNVIRIMNRKCEVINCENDAQEIHHIRKLSR